ncbi:30S ribosomal protein S6--L-glutamate ligase [Candidatus Saccharibacteria bacterium]|nr:30S ribosomal protein S6--L-glutamate ligase [Candidatus Saccharibacteria bacterium]
MKTVILSKEPKSYSTQTLLKAAKKRMDVVKVLDYSRCYMEIEASKPSIYYLGRAVEDVDIVIPRIIASFSAYISTVVRQFEMMRVYSLTSSLAVVRASDKLRSLQLLARSGVQIPKTVFARKTADVTDILDMIGGAPVVVKLLEGNQGIGVVLAETRKAAQSVVEAFYGVGANILIQEYIEEAHGADIRALVVGDEVVGAMLRQGVEGDFRSNLHRGGTTQPVELTTKERNIAIKATKTLGLTVAGVDILRSKRGPLVIEVNASPGFEGIESETGIDIAGIIVDYAISKSSGKRRKDRIGA